MMCSPYPGLKMFEDNRFGIGLWAAEYEKLVREYPLVKEPTTQEVSSIRSVHPSYNPELDGDGGFYGPPWNLIRGYRRSRGWDELTGLP